MWLLIAEMVLALGLIVFIMWWTLRARVDHPADPTIGQSAPAADDKQADPKAIDGTVKQSNTDNN